MGDVAVPDDDEEELVMSGWQNMAFQLCQQQVGEAKFRRRMDRLAQTQTAGFGSRTRLSMQASKAKKTVMGSRSFLRQYNAVGAVGYAIVLPNPNVPPNNFFIPGKRFRIRLRHSNLNCDDDAAACIRETAIKFADQNEDGPFDLILHTGRTALARNCKTFLDVLQHRKPDQIKQLCLKDPHYYFALVDGLRKAPSSYSELHYYSQLPYLFIPSDGERKVLKFRLVPAVEPHQEHESCFLDVEEQMAPWQTERRPTDQKKTPAYLRLEFLKRLEEGRVKYMLQVQICQSTDDDIAWNPQVMWKEESYPWTNLAEVNLTTPLPCAALRRTYFNIVDKPTSLKFPVAASIHDHRSLAHVYCSMYTTIEIRRLADSHVGFPSDNKPLDCDHLLTTHVVSLCTGHKVEAISNIDVFVTLTGTRGRASPQKLDHKAEHMHMDSLDDLIHYQIDTEPIGEILTLTINVKHRHIADDWYLRYVIVTDPIRATSRHFPCHSVLFSKITLRPGEARLPQRVQHEVLKQERQLELRERQNSYQWQKVAGLPSHIRGKDIHDLPINEQLIAEKFAPLQWEMDSSLTDMFVPMLGSVRTGASPGGRQGSMMGGQGMGMGMGMMGMGMGMGMPGMGMGVGKAGMGGMGGKGGMGMGMGMGKGGMGGMGMGKGGMGMGGMGGMGMGRGMGMGMPGMGMGMPGMGMGMPGMGMGMPGMGMNPRMAAMMASLGNPLFQPTHTVSRKPMTPEKRARARARWRKIKLAVKFISRVKLPAGVAGDMCREVEDDVAFGRFYTNGYNPNLMRRCTKLPDNFPVTDHTVEMQMDRPNTCLTEEMEAGHVYLADYGILDGAAAFHKEKYTRFLSAPFCLLYVRSSGDLMPIAIQLHQQPSDENPIWTPSDMAEEWIMAKLWVRCADFHHQHFVEHIMKTHMVVEPFAVGTMRQLSSSHPVYKLLKPHFRYTLVGNTLLRSQLLSPGTAVDRWSAIGSEGFKFLARKYFSTFTFDELDLPKNLLERGVENVKRLPNYFYRDDSLRLWQALGNYCHKIINVFYEDDQHVEEDCEIQAWIKDIAENGFGSLLTVSGSVGLPDRIEGRQELADLLTKIMFTTTCQHSAVHSDGLEIYGFLPLQPTSMRRPTPTCKHNVTKSLLTESLPEHSPETYNSSLSAAMGMCPADENPLGCNRETYFVDPEARVAKEDFRRELAQISRSFKSRNATSRTSYECLIPGKIPNSVEPVPFVPSEMPEDDTTTSGATATTTTSSDSLSNCVRRPHAHTIAELPGTPEGGAGGGGGPETGAGEGWGQRRNSSPDLAVTDLPLCMKYAAQNGVGGDSQLAQRLTVDLFSRAMEKLNSTRPEAPPQTADRKHSLPRCQLKVGINLANGTAKTC